MPFSLDIESSVIPSMESPARLFSFVCISYLLLLLCSSSSLASSGLPNIALSSDYGTGGKKVSVKLYYESLCPYSANFIVNDLIKLFDDGLISIVDLRLVPYGNAKLRLDHSITCQHGPAECLLNTVEACAINAWPELDGHFPFIYCIESLVYKRKYPQWESCFQELGLNPKPINDCYSTGLGKKLELQYGAETDNLQPPHKYVPWVVVDGQPLYEDYENFISYICAAYNGAAVPSACRATSISAI